MITDESQRYAMAQLSDTVLWRYDRRFRRFQLLEPTGGRPFQLSEGKHHAVVVARNETGEIDMSVRSPSDPRVALATGVYGDSWQVVDGDNQAWSLVPEYVLVPDESSEPGAQRLLRIADDAEAEPLQGFGVLTSVAQVPDSRLVVVAGEGAYTVYDPVARLAIRHYELAGKNPSPQLRFRNEAELWLNDLTTMLKVETKQFEAVDAAGSDLLESEGNPAEFGEFGRWTFAADNELCVVTRPLLGDVLVIDTVSMLPVARAQFPGRHPIDAVMVGRNTIVALDQGGRALRKRVKRVRIKFESGSA